LLVVGFLLGFQLLEVLSWLVLVPGLLLIWIVSEGNLWLGLALTPAAGLLHVLWTCGVIALGKRLVLRSVRPGTYPLRSAFGLRKWMADRLMVLHMATTDSLYATLYVLPFLRLLGARVGPRSEVSTVSYIDPDLLTLGTESFVADQAVIGAARFHNGHVVLGETTLGERCFIGNAALVPGDTLLPRGSLIGVLTVAPTGPVEAGTTWLGSPAIFLPRRQASAKFDESRTYRPTFPLLVCRLAIEFLRVVGPSTLTFAAMFLMAVSVLRLNVRLSWPLLVLSLPAVYLAIAALATVVVAALKWGVMGRYRPRVAPQWSHFVWRSELITGLYENVAVVWLVGWLGGTPLMGPALRLFGTRIGRRVYMDTSFVTEFDLVRVGDDAALGTQAALQTHLFEDRVMKLSTVTIGAGCTIGPRSVVLYDSTLEAGAELEGLSLVMKGESLPAQTCWRGIPAQLVE
jgi:non-ribosomal peptide synthetase-like protein